MLDHVHYYILGSFKFIQLLNALETIENVLRNKKDSQGGLNDK